MIEHLPVYPAFEEKGLPIVLESSDYYAPYAAVTMLSIIEHTTPEHNYDFLVLSWDMKEETAQKLISMADGKENISIRVVDVAEKVKPYEDVARKGHFWNRVSSSWVVRVMVPELLDQYDIIVNVDCDYYLCVDIAEIFEYKLDDNYMAATPDVLTYVFFHKPGETIMTDEYIHNRLNLESVSEYLNAGLMLWNLKKVREDFTYVQVIEFIQPTGNDCLTYYEQDAFNGLYAGNKLILPFEWNWQIDTWGIINEGKKYLPENDDFLRRYYDAENKKKTIHYLTSRKPWLDAKVQYGELWWEMARKTAFFNEIISRVGKTNNSLTSVKINKRLFFICDSAYQLINAMNIKIHYYHDAYACLAITSETSLANYVEPVRKTNIFDDVMVLPYRGNADYQKILEIPIKDRTLHPQDCALIPKFDRTYTDLFLPVYKCHYYQMIYYTLLKASGHLSVHIYDEGGASYIENLRPQEYREIDHNLYPEERQFTKNIINMFLYKPSLYSGTSKVQILPIPLLADVDKYFLNEIYTIFGKGTLPKEKYIFFNECFVSEGKPSDEIRILDVIASMVGKENIIVKVHPRSPIQGDIYRLHGYKLFPPNDILWELAVLNGNIEEKVLMAISSNTICSSWLVAGKKSFSVSLLNVMKLSQRPYARTKAFQAFVKKVQLEYNTNETTFFMPNNMMELKNVIRFIEGET